MHVVVKSQQTAETVCLQVIYSFCLLTVKKIKIKLARYRPGGTLGVPGG
jgi:hypothetical protein